MVIIIEQLVNFAKTTQSKQEPLHEKSQFDYHGYRHLK